MTATTSPIFPSSPPTQGSRILCMSNYAQIEVKPLATNEELLRAYSYIGVTCGCIVWRMLDLSWGKLFANDGSYSVEKWQKDLNKWEKEVQEELEKENKKIIKKIWSKTEVHTDPKGLAIARKGMAEIVLNMNNTLKAFKEQKEELLSEAGETHKNFGVQMPEKGFAALEDFIISWQRKMYEQLQVISKT